MKNTIKLVVAIVLIALCGNVSAQNEKIAYINLQDLILAMPEYDSAMVKLQKVGQELENTMEEMSVEYNKKFEDFSKNQDLWSELVKQSKTDELMTMQRRIQSFQEQAQESYQQEQAKLMQPVYEKASKAVETVAKEQGAQLVFDANPQILLYKAPGTLDLLPAAKQHLGIRD